MSEQEQVIETAELMAAAIARRDLNTLESLLAPGFVHRTHGSSAVHREQFLRAIHEIPGEILLVKLEGTEVDLSPTGALVTGFQRARVLIEGQVVEELREFIDWFVKLDGGWRIQAAVDLPGPGSG